MKLDTKTIKLISTFLIILILVPTLLLSQPKKASANDWNADIPEWLSQVLGVTTAASTTSDAGSNAGTFALKVKSFATAILQQLVVTAERQLLKSMTQDTVNWINSGFSGSPLFVQNPDSLLNDIAKTEVKTLINEFGYDPNKYPFGQDFALNLINSYKSTLANDASYSLSKSITDPTLLNNYRTNFNYGGWNGFLINTQYPQNNYIGFNMLATQQLANQLQGTSQSVAQKVQTALNQGQGFLSPKACPTSINPNYNNLTNEFSPPTFTPLPYDPPQFVTEIGAKLTTGQQDELDAYNDQYSIDNNAAQDAFNATSGCINPQTGKSALVATTPGSVVASTLNTALGSPFQSLAVGSQITNSIAAVFDSLISHFVGSGLSALSSTINPAASPVDNFSYEGQTLTNSPTTTNNTGILAISQNVSTNVGNTTNINISGGTPPYIISVQPNPQIATAQISGSTILVSGVGEGSTSILITDSSSPTEGANTQITINGTNLINFDNPTAQNVPTTTGTTTNINISGGTPPYSVVTQPDSNVAVALLSSENTLTIVGVGSGQSSFTVQDSTGKSTNINISVSTPSSPDLSASTQNVTVASSATTSVMISGGTPPYSIQNQPDPNVAGASISDNTLSIDGAQGGSTSVVLQDSSFPVKTITINITSGAATIVSTTPPPTTPPGGSGGTGTSPTNPPTTGGSTTPTSTPPDAQVGQPYSANLAVANDYSTYDYWGLDGTSTLPPGLNLDCGGTSPCQSSKFVIAGTPTVAGTYTFGVQVTPIATSNFTSQPITTQFTLVVDPASGSGSSGGSTPICMTTNSSGQCIQYATCSAGTCSIGPLLGPQN